MTWHAALERHTPGVHVGPGKDFFPTMAGLAVSRRNMGQALRHPESGVRKGEETKYADTGQVGEIKKELETSRQKLPLCFHGWHLRK